jgi:acyl carrier protein
MLEVALMDTKAHIVVAHLNVNASGQKNDVPCMLHGLVRRSSRATSRDANVAFWNQLARLDANERRQVALDLIVSTITKTLGLSSPNSLDIDQPLQKIGLDSLRALEIRASLNAATGLQLPATVLFDYSSPASLARHLVEVGVKDDTSADEPFLAEIDRLRQVLSSMNPGHAARIRGLKMLQDLLKTCLDEDIEERPSNLELATASAEELFKILDGELGLSTRAIA